MAMKVSVVVPTKNEEDVIDKFIQRMEDVLSGDLSGEIIFVDDSTDQTPQKIRKYMKLFKNIKYIEGDGGKGTAINIGFSSATNDFIVMIDADLQYFPEDIPKLLAELEKGYDIAVGKRDIKNINININIKRKIFSQVFRLLSRLFLNVGVSDTQSGLKAIKKSAWQKVKPLKTTGFEFDLEMLYKAKKAGLKVSQCNIMFAEREAGRSKVNVLMSSIRFLSKIIKLRFSHE